MGIPRPARPARYARRQPGRAADRRSLSSPCLAHSRIPEITRHSERSDAMTSIEASAALVLPTDTGTTDVEIVVPVYNEERDLAKSVRRLHAYLHDEFPFTTMITIADNASSDDTWPMAQRLAGELSNVRAVHLAAKGRGRALHDVWTASNARIVAYMDVDLSTDLAAVLPLIAPLMSGHSDVAIGTRLSRTARVVRGPRREIISRAYNLLLHATLRARFPTHNADSRQYARSMRVRCCHMSTTGTGSSTPSYSYWPSGPACESTKCRSLGSMPRPAGWTFLPPPLPTCAESPELAAHSPPARSHCVTCGSS